MATLIDADDLRTRFDIDSEIADSRLELHIDSAARRLRKWVGTTVYDSATAEEPEPDEDLVSCLKNAEAHLAMHFAITGLNSPLSGKGVVATAMSAEGKEMRKYLTPDQTIELSQQFLDLAREIADDYITAASEVDVAIVELDDDEDAEAISRG